MQCLLLSKHLCGTGDRGLWDRGQGLALKFVASYKLPPGGGDFLYKETAEAQKQNSRYL